MTRMIPITTDRETRGFFEAAAQGKLVYRACNHCHHALHPPTTYCRHCGGFDTAWREVRGTGTLHSWTTVVHQVHPAFPTPYTIVVVALDDAPEVRLLGHLEGQPSLKTGMPMKVWFETLPDGTALPQWKPS